MEVIIHKCDKCGKTLLCYNPKKYEQFMFWVTRATCFKSNPLKIREDIDLCEDCIEEIDNVANFIKEMRTKYE